MKESSWEDPRGTHSWMLGLHLNSAPTFPGVILFDGFLGCSVHFTPSLGRLRDGLVEAFIIAREQRAPEMYGSTKYDPSAADIYVVARLFYAWFTVRFVNFLFVWNL